MQSDGFMKFGRIAAVLIINFLVPNICWSSSARKCESLLLSPSWVLKDHLVLSENEFLALRPIVNEIFASAKPEAIVFTGSRTHKLWRSGFDIDIRLIGARNDLSRKFEELKEAYRITFGIRIDILSTTRRSVVELIDGGYLIDQDIENQILLTALESIRRWAEAKRRLSLARSADVGSYFEMLPALTEWVNEPIHSLPNQKAVKEIERVVGPLNPERFESNWRPLGSKSLNSIFYRAAAGLNAFKETGRTFDLTSIAFVFAEPDEDIVGRLKAAGFSLSFSRSAIVGE
jgi:hypothetical protein